MKVSEWIREYQLTGKVPDGDGDSRLPFWAGWLIGGSRSSTTVEVPGRFPMDNALDMAIRIAEYIEGKTK